MTNTHKNCSNCNELKPLTSEYFHKHKYSPNGLRSQCKDCIRLYGQKTRPAARIRHARWIKANPEKAYRFTHPEKSRQASQKWKDDNREHVRQTNLQRAKDNPAQVVVREQRRRARLKGNGGTYTEEEWNNLCAHYNHRCLCCGLQAHLTVDHIVPISKGGINSIENIQPLCQKCNSRKGTKIIDYRY